MGFFSDLGTFGKDIFTGRWTGGETNVVQDVKNDPWVLAAPAAIAATVAAAPFAAPALGGALGIGEGAAGIGAGAEAAGAGTLDAALTTTAPDLLGGYGAGGATTALGGSALPAEAFDPSVTSAFASADTAAGTTGAAPSWLTGAQATPATGAGAFGGAAPDASGGVSSFFSKLGTQIMDNPLKDLGIAASAGGLLYNLSRGNATSPNQDQLGNNAAFARNQYAGLTQESGQLRSYLESGTLPAGYQAQVQQLVQSRKAAAIANAAKNGGSTNPTENTALATDLSNIDQQGLILATNIEAELFKSGQNLLSKGLEAGKLSAADYATLANMDRTDMNNINQSIANMVAAFAGGGKGLNISLGGGSGSKNALS